MTDRTDLTRRLLPFALAAAVLFILILCCSALAADEKEVDVLTIADSTGDWGYPSPYGHYSRGPGYIRMSLIFDTLIWKDQSGFVPALAETWEYLPDEKAYVFHLRKGVTWNDKERFSAKDVAFTFQYIQEHPYSWVDSSIVSKVEAVNDDTVKITLKRDYVPFLDQVAGTLPILPEHIYADVADPANFKDPKALVGTGPFKLVNYDKAQGTYLYEANENYYLGSPKVKQIKFVKVSTEMSAAALKKGDVDAAGVPGETVEDLKKAGFTVIKGSHDWVGKIMVNYRKAPFSDVLFRQALYYAIDRQEIVDTALRGFGLAGSAGLYASDNPWYNPNQEQYAYDPAKAGELLEELGYEKKEGSQYYTKVSKPEEIELLVSASNANIGELIKKQLDKAGIKITLRSVDAKTLDSQVNGWNFDLALSGHGGMGGDPAILKRTVIGTGFNSAGYKEDPELNELFDKADAETDPEKRKELVFQIQEALARDLPALPIYYTESFWASNDKVSFYYTFGGVGSGVPIALNKMAFV
jgi:peptide/nickel transport system substrate-binding protein